MVAERVPCVPRVVCDEDLVAVEFIAQCEEAVLGVADLTLPVLNG